MSRKDAKLNFTEEVTAAFYRAQKKLGKRWNLFGKDRDPRCTVAARYSRGALAGAEKSSRILGEIFRTRYYPCELVRLAAKHLDVPYAQVRGAQGDDQLA